MTSTDPHGRTPDELEREVSQERGRLKETADELHERLSIGALVDDMLDRTRRGGAEGGAFFRNLGRSVRDNPVPVTLMGLGLAWMMSGGQERSADPRRAWDRVRDYVYSDDEDEWFHGEDGEALGERLSARAREARESAGEAGQSAREGISGTAESMREGTRSAAGRVSGAAGRARERSRSAADRAYGTADYATRRARAAAAQARYRARATGASLAETGDEAYWRARDYGRSAYEFAEEQPLVVGALAVALGAALGSLLPNTRAEDRMMGEPAERLRGQAGEALRQESERARRVAEAAVEEGRRAAEQALEEASEEASTVAERAEAGVREAGERVQGAAEQEAERQDLGGTVRRQGE